MNELQAIGLMLAFQLIGMLLYVREYGWKMPPNPAEERAKEVINARKNNR